MYLIFVNYHFIIIDPIKYATTPKTITYTIQNYNVTFSILLSAPASPVVTAILWGDIILPAVAPPVFAAASQNESNPKDLASSTWSCPNKLIYFLVIWYDHQSSNS